MKFFNEKTSTSRLIVKRTPIDVGAGGDCGFLSIAASFIDGALGNDANLDGPLSCIFEEIDQHVSDVTAKQRLLNFIQNVGFETTLSNMATILRRLAVREMIKDPGKYQGSFVKPNEYTAPKRMLESETFIDETAIAALSCVLNIPIELSVVNGPAVLPLTLVYNDKDETQARPIISVQLDVKQKHYQPRVINETTFRHLQKMRMGTDNIVLKSFSIEMPSADKIHFKINEYNQRLVNIYEDAKRRLEAMVLLDGTSKEDLLTLYSEAITSSDYLSGHLEYVSESTKCAIEQALLSSDIIEDKVESHDENVVRELVHAIARAISIGQVPETVLENLSRDRKGVFTK